VVNPPLDGLRREFGRRLKLANPDRLAFAYVRNFPLLRWGNDLGRWESEHHPFTAPLDEDAPLLESAPTKVRAGIMTLSATGTRVGGGSIRIHNSMIQRRIFRLLGLYRRRD